MLAGQLEEHIGVGTHQCTLHEKSSVDLWGTAYAIPVESDSFDSALCTAVMEHLEEPEQALRECHRVLKAGGVPSTVCHLSGIYMRSPRFLPIQQVRPTVSFRQERF